MVGESSPPRGAGNGDERRNGNGLRPPGAGAFFGSVNIGFLGGSFDPVHIGHLCAAQDALEHMALDKVVFVPAAQAPLKPGAVCASDRHRLAMLRGAIGERERFEISEFELERGGVSYTIETVRHFRKAYAFDRLFWIVGADQLSRLAMWMRIDELVRMVEFICLDRPGHPEPEAPAVPGLRLHRCPGHLIEVSSTELRERARQGKPLDWFMPHKAVVYVSENGLYR